MKFRVDRDVLAESAGWVARALPSRPVVPVLSGLRLEAGEARLSLSCFDYEVSAAAQVAAEVEEQGAALVPGRLLTEIVRSLPGQPVEFSSDADMVRMTCGSAEFELVSLPLADYPELPASPPLAGMIDGGELAAAAAQVLPAVSRDDTLPMLTAVCLDVDGDVITLVSTDRYRMAVRDVRWSPADPGLRAVALVPARTLADAARAMAPGVPVSVSFGLAAGEPGEGARTGAPPRPADGVICFDSGGRRLTGRLIGGDYMRYESRFPAGFGCSAEIPAASFTEAVRRVSLVADRASPIRLTFGGGRVVIEAATEGRARAVESVTASFHGDEPSIAFNPHYLLDGLVAAAFPAPGRHGAEPAPGQDGGAESADASAGEGGQPTVRLQFTNAAKPALITWAAAPADPAAPTGEARAGGRTRAPAAGGPDARPAFRYLLVPLRSPTRA